MILPIHHSGYRAAEISRLTKHLPTYAIPAREELAHGKLSILRTRARWVIKNSAMASAFVETCKRRVVGPSFKVQVMMRDKTRYLREENQAAERILRRWERCVTTQGHSMTDAMELLVEAYLSDGEVFLYWNDRAEKEPFSLEYQILHADQLAENEVASSLDIAKGNKVVMGAEVGPGGRPVAWHFYDDGGDVFAFSGRSRTIRRIPSERLLHWYKPRYADFPRGIPPLTPVILDIADEEELRKATLTQAWVQACITAFVYSESTEEDLDGRSSGTGTDSDGLAYQKQRYEQGMLEYLPEGKKVAFAEPKSPGNTYEPFIQSVQRAQARGTGLSYEKYSGDFRGVSFAGGRLLELDDRMLFDTLSQRLDEHIVEPLHEKCMDYLYFVHRLLPMPPASDLYAHFVQHPQPEWVDPVAQENAFDKALKNRTMSRREICARRNRVFEDVAQEIAEEEAYLRELGITAGMDGEGDPVLEKLGEMERKGVGG